LKKYILLSPKNDKVKNQIFLNFILNSTVSMYYIEEEKKKENKILWIF